jgi:hypothetical protein
VEEEDGGWRAVDQAEWEGLEDDWGCRWGTGVVAWKAREAAAESARSGRLANAKGSGSGIKYGAE